MLQERNLLDLLLLVLQLLLKLGRLIAELHIHCDLVFAFTVVNHSDDVGMAENGLDHALLTGLG